MPRYIVLLRAVNVGGTGKLPMSDLKAICLKADFQRVETYIASGNVVFDSAVSAAKVKAELESRLLSYAGKPIAVLVRTASEMKVILEANPFPEKSPAHTIVLFLNNAPPSDALEQVTGLNGEEVRLGKREIYVFYGDGMGRSKLKIPAAREGTGRNINTVRKLIELADKS